MATARKDSKTPHPPISPQGRGVHRTRRGSKSNGGSLAGLGNALREAVRRVTGGDPGLGDVLGGDATMFAKVDGKVMGFDVGRARDFRGDLGEVGKDYWVLVFFDPAKKLGERRGLASWASKPGEAELVKALKDADARDAVNWIEWRWI